MAVVFPTVTLLPRGSLTTAEVTMAFQRREDGIDMALAHARLRRNRQVTLPEEVLRTLRVDEGDEIEFTLTEHGVVMRGYTLVPADQRWSWSGECRAGEREVTGGGRCSGAAVAGDLDGAAPGLPPLRPVVPWVRLSRVRLDPGG